MLNLRLADIATWTGGRLCGVDARIDSVSIDSRTLSPGALFVALPGEHHDAHDFVAAAGERGAAAAMVARELAAELPQVVVADPLLALGELARHVRGRSSACVVGITGSNGKTTVKTLLAAILAQRGTTHVNAGNLNNEIGLPLTLLAMPPDAEFAVLEMGAGKAGDIAYLARIAQPSIALVNNVAAAHLERLGDLEGVAHTKGALISALPKGGCAVINLDDSFADYFIGLAGPRRIVRFGLGAGAMVGARLADDARDQRFTLITPTGEIEVDLPLPGRHNVMNAVAACAAAIAVDAAMPLEVMRDALQRASLVSGRLTRHLHASGAVIFDDTYNANPASFAAAIALLAAEPGDTVLVMGDMAELGADAEQLHFETGALAKWSGIARLHAVGELSRAAVAAFGAGASQHADHAGLIRALRRELRSGVTVLVKGSRSSAMEHVVAALLGAGPARAEDRHAA
ncbi:MAG TPA: UDP-N-acetylmuramoyl-tripeptide--D-alanyl-D-alanine ligase [Rhodanobacteraceae bacterium]|nr:UDP-N-acetylmuramoyl-tripeptide--D-alanyl-D-alanine ligase [Rhodanobacteraceae bacterium]